jgi:hypothetical protein
MSATTDTGNTGNPQSESELEKLRAAARKQGFDHMTNGTWFQRLVASHIKKHAAEIGPDHWNRLYPKLDVEERASKRIGIAARRAAAAGAFASVGASTGELLALVSEGLAAPIGLPAAALSMFAEAAYTARLQVDLACDLASIYDVPFDPNDLGELTTLFGLGFEVDVKQHKSEQRDTSGVTAKLMELEDGEVAKRIGRKLLEESVVRNVLPVVGIPISARWNYVATKRFAGVARKYARYRRALRHACVKLAISNVDDPGLLLQGAWLMATVDGDAGHEELLALALILESLHVHAADAKLEETGDDEEAWFERLSDAPAKMHDALLDVLYLVSATDRELQSSEKRFLMRVGKVIRRPIDLERIEKFCAHLNEGEDLPDGFYHCT